MKTTARISILGILAGLALLCSPDLAHAQWCDVVCLEPYGGLGYPQCNTNCNLGGGYYTTCGEAQYECCTFGIAEKTIGKMRDSYYNYYYESYMCLETLFNAHDAGFACPDGWHGSGYYDCWWGDSHLLGFYHCSYETEGQTYC